MHPFFAERQRLLIYLAGWLAIGLLLSTLVALPGDLNWFIALAYAIPLSFVYAFVCLSAWYLCWSFPLQRTGFAKLLLVYSISASISSSLWLLLSNGWSWVLSQFFFSDVLGDRPVGETQMLFGVGVVLYLLAVTVHYLVIAFEESRYAERRSLELKLLAQEAELKALRAQIDPHFLFNSLNSISALTAQNPAAARHMTLLLSDFLRKSLKYGAQDQIPLQQELSLIQNFLEIEQVRFGKRLRIEQVVDKESESCLVPSLLLQPLIENAINHGIAHIIEGGTIKLRTTKLGTRLTINIENPIDHDRPKSRGSGLGLENVRKRLRTLYNSDARLDAKEIDDGFYTELTLPAVQAT